MGRTRKKGWDFKVAPESGSANGMACENGAQNIMAMNDTVPMTTHGGVVSAGVLRAARMSIEERYDGIIIDWCVPVAP